MALIAKLLQHIRRRRKKVIDRHFFLTCLFYFCNALELDKLDVFLRHFSLQRSKKKQDAVLNLVRQKIGNY